MPSPASITLPGSLVIYSNAVPFPLPQALLDLVQRSPTTGQFKCVFEDCNVSVKSKSDMPRHLRRVKHSSEECKSSSYFKCPIPGCNVTNSQKSNIRAHIGTHSDNRPYRCKICFNTYKSVRARSRHWDYKHPEIPRPKRGNSSTPSSHTQSLVQSARFEREQSIAASESVTSYDSDSLFTRASGSGSVTSEEDGSEDNRKDCEASATKSGLDILADLCALQEVAVTKVMRYDPVREAAGMQ